MPQRPTRLLYLLLAIVAFFAFTHFFLGARHNYDSQKNGRFQARAPFSGSYKGATLTLLLPETREAGLIAGDRVLTVNGRPYLSGDVVEQEARRSEPGMPMVVTYRRNGDPAPRTASVTLRAVHPRNQPLWSWVVLTFLTVASFFCLVTGLYVAFARPLNGNAWLILGILSFFNSLFIATQTLSGPLKPVAMIWATVSQSAMPICLMLFGVYFPDRSKIDIRYPWIKWTLMLPIFVLAPLDLLQEFSRSYNFSLAAWLVPFSVTFGTIETVIAIGAINYFFISLFFKIRTARGDGRRRLRILYAGTSIGLTPFFVLAIIALFRKTDIGQDIPEWIVLSGVSILFLFPMSLAYVVVVQRALDLKLLIRQGTKYAFAKQSVVILQVALGVWFGFALVDFFHSVESHRRLVDIVRIFGIMVCVFSFRFVVSKKLQQRIDQRFFREAYSAEQLLSELSEEARNFTEVAPLLNTITQRIGETLHIDRIAVFLRSGDTYRLQLATGMPGATMMPPLLSSISLPATSATITTLARDRGPANVYRDDPSSWLVDATEAERRALNDLSTELLVPLPGRKQLAGVMALGPKRSEEPYTRTDRQLLQSVASQAGMALENAELLENLSREITQRERVSREIEIAREVQERLFPQSYPKIAGVDIAGYCRPAQAIGGDYYDFFLLPSLSQQAGDGGELLVLALGDISGKGISAALLMASLRASLRSGAQLRRGDQGALMEHVNGLVYDSSTSNRYATFFYAEYDPQTRLLSYVNAGHNPPLVLRGDRQIALEATGTVIGLLPESAYEKQEIVLEPGDVLIAFTDGISEAMNPVEEEWGEDRMIAAARSILHRPDCTVDAEQMMNCILDAADVFTSGADQHDDMTLLICMVRE